MCSQQDTLLNQAEALCPQTRPLLPPADENVDDAGGAASPRPYASAEARGIAARAGAHRLVRGGQFHNL